MGKSVTKNILGTAHPVHVLVEAVLELLSVSRPHLHARTQYNILAIYQQLENQLDLKFEKNSKT